MITREDILERAAASIYLGMPPARAITQAYNRAIAKEIPALGLPAFDTEFVRNALPLGLAYILDVTPELAYTLYYPTAAAKLTMSPYVHGTIIDDFTHRGESSSTVSKYLLAFAKAGEMNRFPTELVDLVDAESLTPLPSRASGLYPFASPQAEPAEPESFDPDLDEDPEEYLYDDLGD